MSRKAEFLAVVKTIVDKDSNKKAKQSTIELAQELSDVLMSPIYGFENAVDVAIFVLILGGFLAIVQKSGALENGIKVLVK